MLMLINTEAGNRCVKMVSEFKNRCRQFLQVACVQIRNRYDFSNEILSTLHIFNVNNAINPITRTSFPSMIRLCELLPRCKDTMDIQNLDDEWRMMAYSKIPTNILQETEIDSFWGKMYNFKNENNVFPFRNLAKFILNILSLPHANADCERIFSLMNIIKSKIRNNLNNDSVSKITLAKEAMKRWLC